MRWHIGDIDIDALLCSAASMSADGADLCAHGANVIIVLDGDAKALEKPLSLSVGAYSLERQARSTR
jgi:hypothetical protein